MIFTIIKNDNGKLKRISAHDLDFYCECPNCKKMVQIPLYEWLSNGVDIDFDCSIYCDTCSDALNKIKEDIKSKISTIDTMPPNKLNKIHNIVTAENKKFNE